MEDPFGRYAAGRLRRIHPIARGQSTAATVVRTPCQPCRSRRMDRGPGPRAGAGEWIEDQVPVPGAGENAKLGEIGRESRIVSLGGRLALELQDIASIAQAADIVPESAVATIAVIALVRPNKVIRAGMIAHCGLRDRASVIVVAPSFAEQKNVFMRAGRAVADRFGHRVGLGPNYIGAQIPAISLKGEGDAPGNSDQVLGLE